MLGWCFDPDGGMSDSGRGCEATPGLWVGTRGAEARGTMVRRALRAVAAGVGLLAVLLAGAPAGAAAVPAVPLSGGGDCSCLEEVRSAWEQSDVYVHHRITAMFPEVTAEAVAEALGEETAARVAVVLQPQTPPPELASQLHVAQGRQPVALYTWQGDAFRADVVTGAEVPRTKRTLAGPSRRVAPDDLLVHVAAVAVILRGEVLSTAAQQLAETSLYVSPGLSTDLTDQRIRDLAQRFAGLPEPVRVALLPRDAVEYEGGVVRRGAGNIAELVQGQRDVPAVVYLVDENGRVTAGSASSTAVGLRSQLDQGSLSQIVTGARDSDSATATLTALAARLEDASEGNSAVERLIDVLLYALPFLIVLGVGALLMIPVRQEKEIPWPAPPVEDGADAAQPHPRGE